MIISQQRSFIFVAIPKTGTHAVRRALREHLGPQDQEQVGLFVQKRIEIDAIAELGHGHVSLAQIRPHMPPEAFSRYFKFAFVRNPFDRFISFCAFMMRENGSFERNPQEVMRFFLERRPFHRVLFAPQHSFVADGEGVLLTDAIGRVETMQQSYDAICARIGIPTAALERVNTSRRDDYRRYYDSDELIEGVAELYRRDLDVFGYTFDGALA